jgi:iron complex outermembrane recepter protein
VTRFGLWLLASTAFPLAGPAYAQEVPAQPSTSPAEQPEEPSPGGTAESADVEEDDVIEVIGQRERGSVPGDVRPEQVLRPADIRAYGVSSIAELLTELAPQTGGGRGREGGQPVVLLNGRRISGFREIRDLPTEAIERTEILPPEAAQQLGYRADQRVVNIVLRRRFNAITAELSGGGATDGDRYTVNPELNIVRIARDRRLSVNLEYQGQTPVYEDDRNLLPTQPTRPYGIVGNLTPFGTAGEIDPALSALAGRPVTLAGVPDDVSGRPSLASFLRAANPSDFGAYRTLSPASRTLSTNATYSQPILGNVTASVNVSFESTASSSELGLGSAALTVPAGSPYSPFTTPVVLNRYLVEAGARGREVDGNVAHVGLNFNGDLGEWRWSVIGNYDRTWSRTWTDQSPDLTGLTTRIAAGDPAVNPFGRFDPVLLGDFRRDYARSISNVANASANVNGPLFQLPAGRVNASIRAGFEVNSIESRTVRSGVVTPGETDRSIGSGQVRIDVPLTSRRTGVLDAIGNLSVNGTYAIDRTSDYGAQETRTYGLNWSPIPQVTFLATRTTEEDAPTAAQLNNPQIITPDARVFDFVTGQSVDATLVEGGNPALLASDRKVTSLTLNLQPFNDTPFNATVEYTATSIDNPVSFLPAPTQALERAFPDRFQRDVTGRLLRFDNRPVNFTRSEQRQLRTGFNFSKQIGAAPTPSPAVLAEFRARAGARRQQRDGATPPPGDSNATPTVVQPTDQTPPREGGGRRFGGPGGGGFGGGGFGGGRGGGLGAARLQLSVFHTWRLEDTVLIRPGLPELDLLDGDATDTRGGRPEHQIEFNAGLTKGGYGLRVSGNYQVGTTVQGGTAAAPTQLNFGALTTVTVRGFVDFNPLMKVARDHPWLRGTRVSLAVRNLFNQRLDVTDPTGATPLNYQPALLDPIGRTVTLSIRKLLF